MDSYEELVKGLQERGWTDGLTPDEIRRERNRRQERRAWFFIALALDVINQRRRP